ncbi:MAG: tryptophan synthase subunit alpha [Deltaproteobacteria bacterium]|nr:tryptophan synthase subunit alpha [Deltaproteobacteria bacterium]
MRTWKESCHDLTGTRLFVHALAQAGADIIELGVPFSDPVADGPVNQAAATRALLNGTTLESILLLVRELRSEGVHTPIVLFTYLNPIFRMGYADFAAAAKESGISGVLCVDLPPEEAANTYLPTLRAAGLDTIFLASPTTADDRLELIDSSSSGFVYYASRTGVTGVQQNLSTTLNAELDRVRSELKKPIAVGFGISTPEHVRALASNIDAVVVGSALVKIIEQSKNSAAAARDIAELTKSLVKELKKC